MPVARVVAGMRLSRWIRRLEREADVVTVELRCPECGAEFVAKGEDPVLEYLAHEWAKGYDGETYQETPADVVRIANHEHDPSLMVNKATGNPWVADGVPALSKLGERDGA